MENSPYFVIYKDKLIKNLEYIKMLKGQTGIEIYFTLKALNHKDTIAIIAKYLDGFSVSSPKEATLAQNVGAKKINLYSVAFDKFDYKNIDRVTFNSINQYKTFAKQHSNCGIRINPNISFSNLCNYTTPHLGVTFQALNSKELPNLKGLHFHVMFNANEDDFEILLENISKNCQNYLSKIEWLNLGGGYNLTKFNPNKFIQIVENFKSKYPNLSLILEPGEGVLKDIGELNAQIIDIIGNNIIINASTQNHLLDIAMVKKRYNIKQSDNSGKYQYKIYGNSCINNDYFGAYKFSKELQIYDTVTFEDAIGYTLTKQTNFTLQDSVNVVFT